MNISPPEENYIKSDDEDNEEEETFCDTWIQYFCSLPGNEFYCEVDKEYIEDSFNLFGLRNYFDSSTTDYSDALAFIVDKQPSAAAEGHSIDVTGIQKMAEILYALIHSRFIITSRGLDVMVSNVNILILRELYILWILNAILHMHRE